MLRFVLSAVVCLVGSVANAQTPFPARFVDPGQVVTVPAGEYLLTRETIVRGGTLVLEAGVKIKVQSVGRPFQVASGTFEIRGTAADPVVVEPAAGAFCGHVLTYAVNGARPKVTINYLDWTTTKNGTAFVFSATDATITNSAIYSGDPLNSRRGCLQFGGGSIGAVGSCLLECLKTTGSVTSGVIVGNGASQDDKVQLSEIVTINCSNPLNVNNRTIATINGTVE